MKKDTLFARKKPVQPFEFNEDVADVFDDMLGRSVPLYQESIRRQAQMARVFYQPGTKIYDLGCSHGNLGMQILSTMGAEPFSMIGVDNSRPMIAKYHRRLTNDVGGSRVQLLCTSMEDVLIQNASVIVVNLTLQFLPPPQRDELISKIYKGLMPGGVLLLTEKVVHESNRLADLQIEFYQRFKAENGYSSLEISQKRDALEKVLIPDSLAIHQSRLSRAGFLTTDVWLKWFNFASILAVKD